MKKKINQQDKAKIRHTPEWNELRETVSDNFNRLDPISLKPLRKGWTLHHMSQDANNYADFTETDADGNYRFLPLNKQQHELLHVLYRYASKDTEYIERLLKYLRMMIELNSLSNK